MTETKQPPLTLWQNGESLKPKLLRWWQSMMLPERELKEKKIIPAPSGMKTTTLPGCDQ